MLDEFFRMFAFTLFAAMVTVAVFAVASAGVSVLKFLGG